MEFTVAGAYSTRRLEHVLDLSSRLLFPTDANFTTFVPVSVATALALPGVPNCSTYSTWPNPSGSVQPSGVPRIVNYEELPQDAGHVRARLSGVTNNEL